MSLDRAIEHGKEKRKPYRGSKRSDKGCRCHGDCGYCQDDRFIQARKEKERILNEIQEEYQLLKDDCETMMEDGDNGL